MDARESHADTQDQIPEYDKLLELENLESLLEELEELGWEADEKPAQLPGDLQALLDEAQVSNLAGLRDKIARLHASIDAEDQFDYT